MALTANRRLVTPSQCNYRLLICTRLQSGTGGSREYV